MEMMARSASGLSQTGNYLRVRHSIAISLAPVSSCICHSSLWAHAALRVTLYSGVRAVLLDFCYRGVYSTLSEPDGPS